MPRTIVTITVTSLIALTAGIAGTALAYEEAVVKPDRESTIEFVGELLGQIDALEQEKFDDSRVCGELLQDAATRIEKLEAAYDDARDSINLFFTRGSYLAGDPDTLYVFLSVSDNTRYSAAQNLNDQRDKIKVCLGTD